MVRDDELLRADDDAAFATLVARHQDRLLRYVTRRLGPNDAAAITNDVFLTAHRLRERFTGADAAPWLLGIATNLVRQHARTEARMLRRFAATGIDPAAPERPETDVAVSAAVAAALKDMKPKHRDVLFLHAVAELTLEEIAVAMDAPLGSVKAWLHRARQHGQRVLDRRTGTDDTTLRTEAP